MTRRTFFGILGLTTIPGRVTAKRVHATVPFINSEHGPPNEQDQDHQPPVTPFRSRPQWAGVGVAELTTDGAQIYAELPYRTEDNRQEHLTFTAKAGTEVALFLNPLGANAKLMLGIVITKA